MITVKEFIEELNQYPQSAKIRIHTNSRLNMDILSIYGNSLINKKSRFIEIDVGSDEE